MISGTSDETHPISLRGGGGLMKRKSYAEDKKKDGEGQKEKKSPLRSSKNRGREMRKKVTQ